MVKTDATIYSSRDIQRRLGVTRQTARNLCAGGAFPNAFRVGGNYRVPASDVDAYIEKNRVSQPPRDRDGG